MANRVDTRLIFPIGHYMGPFHPTRNAPALHHVVRVGWDTLKLPDQAHLDIWSLAHGLPERMETPWTRPAIVEAAGEARVAGAESIIDTLLDGGLLAAVESDSDQALEFASGFRMRALLVGLGNTPDDPALDGIGLSGLPPLLRVRPRVFEIWQWGHLWPSIWSACEGLAEVARETPDSDPAATEPREVLAYLLGTLSTLLARNALYLDAASTNRSGA